MPRPKRDDCAGAIHHVMNRGARRAPIFKSNDHCILFLDCIDDAVAKYDLLVLAYALMPNHFHLLVRSPESGPILSRAMRYLQSRYAQRINRMRKWDGPLFRGRFKSQPVPCDASLIYPFAYIHLNPVRARLVSSLEDEAWTSMRAYLELEPAPRWLDTDFAGGLLGDGEFLRAMTTALRRGEEEWPAGMDQSFGWLASDRAERPDRRKRRGRGQQVSRMSVNRVLSLVRDMTGASVAELRRPVRGRGAQSERRFAVWALSESTHATQAEIGRALNMSASQVGVVAYRLRQRRSSKIQSWIDRWEFRQ